MKRLATFITLAAHVASTVIPRDGTCASYTIISTRGTAEPQGPCPEFQSMNHQILSAAPGGRVVNTLYPASWDQDSSSGTQDIIDKVTQTLGASPDECIVLQGYSQGAAATIDALASLSEGGSFDAVRGVLLLGDPRHTAGLACNVDGDGGHSTTDVDGLEVAFGGVPDEWVPKTLDVCIFGDGVCDTLHGFGIDPAHLAYAGDNAVQSLGAKFVLGQLGGG